MVQLAGPLFIAALLLVFAGVPKLAQPGDTVGAMRSAGLPSSDLLVRVLAAVEIVAGIAVITYGGRLTAAVAAVLYLGFTGFIVLAIGRGGSVASCGCFGKADTPPTYAHLILNGAAVIVATAAVASPPGSLIDLLDDQPLFGIPFMGFVIVGSWLAYLTLTLLPRLQVTRSTA